MRPVVVGTTASLAPQRVPGSCRCFVGGDIGWHAISLTSSKASAKTAYADKLFLTITPLRGRRRRRRFLMWIH